MSQEIARNASSKPRRRLRRFAGIASLLAVFSLLASVAGGAAGSYDPAADGYSMANLTRQMGAAAWWNAGYTGAGVDVAVIDTGVTRVPALSGPGKVVYGPDLSTESQTSLRNLDSYGHGTFMAGLIAGHAPALRAPYSQAPATAYRGVAPDARIISVKVGTTDGGVDVTQVIAAIDWVVQHAHDPGFDIRVISLSYGTASSQPYTVDPLAYAAEQAWKHGIVVVAAAGNTGGRHGLADPAYDPYIIGVGAADTQGTATFAGDAVAGYSASAGGRRGRAPDFVAPGSHLQGLRVPGSYIDDENPPGILDSAYMRGSGTSEAAAVTAGAVALILQKYPEMTPDQVKAFIEQNAHTMPGAPAAKQGHGELDLAAMLGKAPQGYANAATDPLGVRKPHLQPADPPAFKPDGPTGAVESFRSSTGSGTLDGSRGSVFLTAGGKKLTGQIDIFGHPFDSSAIASAEAAADSWSGGIWNGSRWSGGSWVGTSWSGNSWSSDSWGGNSWSGNSWSGNSWSGNSWSGNSWSSGGWSGSNWLGAVWR